MHSRKRRSTEIACPLPNPQQGRSMLGRTSAAAVRRMYMAFSWNSCANSYGS